MAEKEKAAVVAIAAPEELPKTIVRRLVKDKLSELCTDGEVSVLREALLAFSESGRIFIHYLSATANDICKESKRQTINAEDVFKALEEIEFPELAWPLRASLEEFRQKNAGKRSGFSKAKDGNKRDGNKRSKKEPIENGDEGQQADGDERNDHEESDNN